MARGAKKPAAARKKPATAVTKLFDHWKEWCGEQGRNHPGTMQTFGRDLRAAVPGLKTSQPWINGQRKRHYEGIGLA